MSYKRFRESEIQHYSTKEGRMTRAEIIKKLESFLTQKQGEGQDFFDKYEIKEER